jgi:thiamine monophosphate kinase
VSVHDAATSGEEYELLVAAGPLDLAAFAAANGGLRLTPIGRVESGPPGGEALLEERGVAIPRPPTHDHFARR